MVFMKFVLVMMLFGIGALGQTFQPASCRYWCQSPTYPPSYYCCPNGGVKQGTCPLITSCPPFNQQQVLLCTSDDGCAGDEKCCYQPCYGVYVCITPVKPEK